MRRTKTSPEVNAGSMADIAFLLLIFFLVTAVIPKDKGINRKLPNACPAGVDCSSTIAEQNVLEVAINATNDIMVGGEITSIKALKDLTKAFIDNNANGNCTYCNGTKAAHLSVHPTKAVISLKADRNSNYNHFIQVQDELTKAYVELRTAYAKTQFKKSADQLTASELQEIRAAYPLILSEATLK